MTEIETIAKGLTEAQKRSLLATKQVYRDAWVLPEFGPHRRTTNSALARKKLAELWPLSELAYSLTPLGQAVRDYLKGEK